MTAKQLAVLVAVAVCSLSIGVASQKYVGLLTKEPALMLRMAHFDESGLIDLRSPVLFVPDIPSEVADQVTKDDVETWAENRLKNIGVKLISGDQAFSRFSSSKQTDDLETLKARDQLLSTVRCSMSTMKETNSQRIYYTASLTVDRGVFQYPGFYTPATVWTRGSFGYCHRDQFSEAIRDSINGLFDEFAKDWAVVNKK